MRETAWRVCRFLQLRHESSRVDLAAQAATRENQTEADGQTTNRSAPGCRRGTQRREHATHWECCMMRGFLWNNCETLVTETSFHPDVPATALLYDNVNAVYTKMYFLMEAVNVYS